MKICLHKYAKKKNNLKSESEEISTSGSVVNLKVWLIT